MDFKAASLTQHPIKWAVQVTGVQGTAGLRGEPWHSPLAITAPAHGAMTHTGRGQHEMGL